MANQKDFDIFKRLVAEAFNYEAAMEARNVIQDDVDNFREILLSCETVPKSIPDKALLLCLLVCDKDIDKSLNLLNNYCVFSRSSPEFFANRDGKSKEVQMSLANQYYAWLPPTPNDYNLVFHKLSNNEPEVYVFDDAEKTFLMTIGK